MELTPEYIDLFDKYIRKELSPDALQNFQIDLASNPELEALFQSYLETVQLLSISGKEELKKRIHEKGKVRYFSNQWGKTWNLASAAIILLFIGLYWVIETKLSNTIKQPDSLEAYEEKNERAGTEDVNAQNNPIDEKTINSNRERLAETSENTAIEEDPEIEFDEDDDAMIYDIIPPPSSNSAGVPPPSKSVTSDKRDLASADHEKESVTMTRSAPESTPIAQTQIILDTTFQCPVSNTSLYDPNSEWIHDPSKTFSLQVKLLKSPLNYKGYESSINSRNASLSIWGLQANEIKKIWVMESPLKKITEIILITKDGRYYAFLPNNSQYVLPLIQDESRKKTLSKLNEN
jgi:hypothetical protein